MTDKVSSASVPSERSVARRIAIGAGVVGLALVGFVALRPQSPPPIAPLPPRVDD